MRSPHLSLPQTILTVAGSFVVNLDPNGKQGLGIPWPRYDTQKRQSMMFQDSALFPLSVVRDDYRDAPLDFIANLSLIHPI